MKQLHDALIAWCMHSSATDLSLYNIYVCFSLRLTVFLLFICIYDSVSKQLSDPLHISVLPLSVKKNNTCVLQKSSVPAEHKLMGSQATFFFSFFFNEWSQHEHIS